MYKVYERTFRIRHYECDAYGHLNNTNYLRYMQESAFDASIAVGYGIEAYNALGCYWLIRLTDVEYLQPLQYNDVVRVKTWVEDMHRVRTLRKYEFWKDNSDQLMARAETDWVYMDRKTNRPKTIPDEVVRAYLPGDANANRERRKRFPEPPEPPEGVFIDRRQVEWRDLDSGQHVNNAVYLSYIQECGVRVADAHGWSMARMSANGFGIIARRHIVEYRQPAILGDSLEVATWVSDAKRSTARRHFVVSRIEDGEILFRCNSLYVWVDIQSGKPIRIPVDFLSDFADNIVEAK